MRVAEGWLRRAELLVVGVVVIVIALAWLISKL